MRDMMSGCVSLRGRTLSSGRASHRDAKIKLCRSVDTVHTTAEQHERNTAAVSTIGLEEAERQVFSSLWGTMLCSYTLLLQSCCTYCESI